jgi:hypothetical protein
MTAWQSYAQCSLKRIKRMNYSENETEIAYQGNLKREKGNYSGTEPDPKDLTFNLKTKPA